MTNMATMYWPCLGIKNVSPTDIPSTIAQANSLKMYNRLGKNILNKSFG